MAKADVLCEIEIPLMHYDSVENVGVVANNGDDVSCKDCRVRYRHISKVSICTARKRTVLVREDPRTEALRNPFMMVTGEHPTCENRIVRVPRSEARHDVGSEYLTTRVNTSRIYGIESYQKRFRSYRFRRKADGKVADDPRSKPT